MREVIPRSLFILAGEADSLISFSIVSILWSISIPPFKDEVHITKLDSGDIRTEFRVRHRMTEW